MNANPAYSAMKKRILETADRLFYERGIHANGVDTIAAETGISKRTLYNHFPSKEALILAYLDRRFQPVPESEKEPLEQIGGTFDRLEKAFASVTFRGCPFVNAVAELGDANAGARKIAVAFKENRRQWLCGLTRRLGAADPDFLATQIAILIDGAIAAGLVRRDPAMARAAKAAVLALIDAATVNANPELLRKAPLKRKRRPSPR
jgi:AcrR family transcriptional regulator